MSFFTDVLAQAKTRASYWAMAAKSDFSTAIWREMKRQNIGKKELAKKMEVSPSMITRIMKGNHNMTIETMTKAAFALNMQLNIQLHSKIEKSNNRTDLLLFDMPFDPKASNDNNFKQMKIVENA